MRHPVPDEELHTLIEPALREEIGDPVPVTLAASTVYLPILVVGLLLSIFWQETLPGPSVGPGRVAADAGIGLAVAAVMVAVTWSLSRFLRPLRDLEIEFRRVLGPLSGRQIALLSLQSGIAEELLFRGSLQPWLGFVATSLIFGALHFVPSRIFLPWTLFAITAGFVFGALFIWRGSLLSPVVAHTVVNAVNLYLIVSGRRLAPAAGSP